MTNVWHFLKLHLSHLEIQEDSERKILGAVYRKPNPKAAIGVLRLVPKNNDVKNLNVETWKVLLSRTLRGAENCR